MFLIWSVKIFSSCFLNPFEITLVISDSFHFIFKPFNSLLSIKHKLSEKFYGSHIIMSILFLIQVSLAPKEYLVLWKTTFRCLSYWVSFWLHRDCNFIYIFSSYLYLTFYFYLIFILLLWNYIAKKQHLVFWLYLKYLDILTFISIFVPKVKKYQGLGS